MIMDRHYGDPQKDCQEQSEDNERHTELSDRQQHNQLP